MERERGPGTSVRSSIERVTAIRRPGYPSAQSVPRYPRDVDEADLHADPVRELERWYERARAAGCAQPEAMALATASPDGAPSVRMVLLKGIDRRGLTFFTNRESRKGRELAENPRAAALLYWEPLGRQVRVEGAVTELSRDEVEAYWRSRPRGSRLAARASAQSRPVQSRAALEARFGEEAARYPGEGVELPAEWSGFRLVPAAVELWEHRHDRLHDRVRYEREGAGWCRERLAP